jgi:hypothetical protein
MKNVNAHLTIEKGKRRITGDPGYGKLFPPGIIIGVSFPVFSSNHSRSFISQHRDDCPDNSSIFKGYWLSRLN